MIIEAESLFSPDLNNLGARSSAAITIALLAALHHHVGGRCPTHNQIFQLALDIHRFQQGNIWSGVDIAASIFGGFINFRIHPYLTNAKYDIRSINLPQKINLKA
jgi:phosphomevalonate kinase